MTERRIIRKPLWPDDSAAIAAIDASYSSEQIHRVEFSGLGISIRQSKVAPAYQKTMVVPDLVAEVQAASKSAVVEIDSRVCAVAAIQLEAWNRRAILRHFYVDKSKRRTGIGSELLGFLLWKAANRGARCLWVETQNTNDPAIQFYLKNGFQFCGVDSSLYAPEGAAPAECAMYFVHDLKS